MINAYKLYLPNHKYKVIDEQEFIDIAKNKVIHNSSLRKDFFNKEITKLSALRIYRILNINVLPVNALLVETGQDQIYLKTIEKMEQEIAKFIIETEEHTKEDKEDIKAYLSGYKEAFIAILLNQLHYKIIDKERTIEDFIEKEAYQKVELLYKKNKIIITLTPNDYICNYENKTIYKYQSSILDPAGYQFHFKKNELFPSREEAINESKKLIDENYNLPIRNSKIQKIIVRTDENKTIIVFWPETVTDDHYIISNDVIGKHDLGGDTQTSFAFFDRCKDATPKELAIAKSVIEKSLKLQTYNVKHL